MFFAIIMQLNSLKVVEKINKFHKKMKLKLIFGPKIQINIAKSSPKTSRTFEKKMKVLKSDSNPLCFH